MAKPGRSSDVYTKLRHRKMFLSPGLKCLMTSIIRNLKTLKDVRDSIEKEPLLGEGLVSSCNDPTESMLSSYEDKRSNYISRPTCNER